MKVKCWKCKGKGRLRDVPITWAEWVIPVVGLMRSMIESNHNDDRWWHDCNICNGKGYQKINEK